MASKQQVMMKTFGPLMEKATDASKEYIIAIKQDSVSIPYTVTDMSVTDTVKQAVVAFAAWAKVGASYVGVGEESQAFYSDDDNYQYVCVADGWWRKLFVAQNVIQLFKDAVDDSAGIKSITDMNTAFPGAEFPQRINGAKGYYERTMAESWRFVPDFMSGNWSNTPTPVGATIAASYSLKASDHGAVFGVKHFTGEIQLSGMPAGFQCTLLLLEPDPGSGLYSWQSWGYTGTQTLINESNNKRLIRATTPDGINLYLG